jgi:hypothetical protein
MKKSVNNEEESNVEEMKNNEKSINDVNKMAALVKRRQRWQPENCRKHRYRQRLPLHRQRLKACGQRRRRRYRGGNRQ